MVEGARLLSEYTVKNCIVGSNPILSASQIRTKLLLIQMKYHQHSRLPQLIPSRHTII